MERDDLINDHEYSLLANHDEEHGIPIRKKIWKVTIILTAITFAEVFMGATIKQYLADGSANPIWPFIRWSFIILTVVKASYIVLVFMHLGDERKNFKWVILGPYIMFILYLIFICLTESTYWYEVFAAGNSITP